MAKAAKPAPKPVKKEPVDKGMVTTLVAAHLSAHGKVDKPMDYFVDLAREIDEATSGKTDDGEGEE